MKILKGLFGKASASAPAVRSVLADPRLAAQRRNLPYMFGDAGCGHLTYCAEHPRVLAFRWACH